MYTNLGRQHFRQIVMYKETKVKKECVDPLES